MVIYQGGSIWWDGDSYATALKLDGCSMKWQSFVLLIWDPPHVYHGGTGIIFLFALWFLFPMQPLRVSRVYSGGCWWGNLMHEPLWRPLGLNHVYPHLSLPLLLSLRAKEVDDSHPFFSPDSGVFALPLIHPRDPPCNCVLRQQDQFLFALPCCTRNKSVRPEVSMQQDLR